MSEENSEKALLSQCVTLCPHFMNMFTVDESGNVPNIIYIGNKEQGAAPGKRAKRVTGAWTDMATSYVRPQVSDSCIMEEQPPKGFAGWSKQKITQWQAWMRARKCRIKKAAVK